MATSGIRVILVAPSPSSRDQVRNLILGMDSVLLEAEYASYEAAAGAFAESRPDGAIIALDADPPTALQLVGELLGEYPRLAVIVLSARADLLVQAYRLGAKSLLDYPV